MVLRNAFGDVATEVTLAAILAELGAKLEPGQQIALDAATLAALETINAAVTGTVAVSNFPAEVEVKNDTGTPLSTSRLPIAVSTANSTVATLGAGATFTGTYEDVLAYQQQAINVFVRPNILISGDASDAKGSLYLDYHDASTGAALTQIPYVVRVPGLFIPQVPITVRQWFRIRYVNDGGAGAITALGLAETPGTPTAQTQMSIRTLLYPQATKELLRTLDQGLSGSDPATVTKSVGEGRNPDGMFTDIATGGTRTLTPATAPLAANASYTSDWMDTEKYPTVRLLIAADQASANNGVSLQWSDTPTGVTIRTTETNNFRTANIANGKLILASTRARYLRVVYLNGGTVQGRFFLNLRLNPVPVTNEVALTLPSIGQTGQQDVTTAPVVLNSGLTLAGRDSIRLKNLTTSARPMFYGFDGGVTVLNGDELGVGEAVDLDLDDSVLLYVITTSTSGAGVRVAWTEIG